MAAYHDPSDGSIERGNMLGDRASVRQSRLFRQYESGNAVKSLLGTDSIVWDVDRKEGVFKGEPVYDCMSQSYDTAAAQRAAQHELKESEEANGAFTQGDGLMAAKVQRQRQQSAAPSANAGYTTSSATAFSHPQAAAAPVA